MAIKIVIMMFICKKKMYYILYTRGYLYTVNILINYL